MKKILFVCMLVLSGCGCIIGQIPPQYLYSGADCQAPLPNYRNILKVSDNCEVASVLQIPEAGFMLNNITRAVNTTLRVTDNSGNFRQIIFSVVLVDTIKPIIEIDTSLLSYRINQIKNYYNAADELMEQVYLTYEVGQDSTLVNAFINNDTNLIMPKSFFNWMWWKMAEL